MRKSERTLHLSSLNFESCDGSMDITMPVSAQDTAIDKLNFKDPFGNFGH